MHTNVPKLIFPSTKRAVLLFVTFCYVSPKLLYKISSCTFFRVSPESKGKDKSLGKNHIFVFLNL